MSSRTSMLVVSGAVALTAAIPRSARAQQQQGKGTDVQLREWTVPWARSRPRDPYPDAKGRVWFVGQVGNYVAWLEPASGTFKRFEVAGDAHPHDLVVDTRGQVWFTGNTNGTIVRLDPETGKQTTFPVPDGVRDPHTMVFDRRGDVWFTAQGAGVVGRLTPTSGAIRLWHLAEGSRPYGIVVDSKGRPWFAEFGTNRIGTIDPTTLELKEHVLPNDRARPRRIAVTADDAVWYGDYTRGFLGRLDPASGRIEEWPLPRGAASMPYAMTADDAGRVWLVETGSQPNRLVGFDTRARRWTSDVAIPADVPNTIRHMVFQPTTRTIWYGSDANTIGRAVVGPVLVP